MDIDAPFVNVEEYSSRFGGRLFGTYAGVVQDIEDPKKLGRVRALIPNVYGDDVSPWIMPCFPGGVGVDAGMICIPREFQYIWVTFEEGDPRSPIYMGGFAIETDRGRDSDLSALEDSDVHQDNVSPLPTHAQGLPDGTDTEGTINDYRNIPPSSFRGQYGKVQITRTQLGNVIELNDSDDATRVFISHGPSGAFYEIRHDGTIIESTSALKRTLDSGIHSVHEGPSTLEYDSSLDATFGGRLSVSFLNSASVSFGEQSLDLDAGLTASVDDFSITSKGRAVIEGLSTASLIGADGLLLSSGGNRVDIAVGSHDLTASNAFDPTGLLSTLSLHGMNGLCSFKASDRLGIQSKGLEAIETSLPNGGDVILGNLTLPEVSRRSPISVPLVKEGVVMGTQLQIALTALTSALSTYTKVLSTGGTTPGGGAPNPVLATANVALSTALDSWISVYGTPLGNRVQPFYASDSVFVTK